MALNVLAVIKASELGMEAGAHGYVFIFVPINSMAVIFTTEYFLEIFPIQKFVFRIWVSILQSVSGAGLLLFRNWTKPSVGLLFLVLFHLEGLGEIHIKSPSHYIRDDFGQVIQ